MISSAIIFLILATFCFVFGSRIEKNNKELNVALILFVSLAGYLLGPQFLAVIDLEIKHNFDILISIGLGVVGFVLGIQAKSIRQQHTGDIFSFHFKFLFLLLVVSLSSLLLKDFLPTPELAEKILTIPVHILGHNENLKISSDLLWISLLLGLSSITSSLLIDKSHILKFEINDRLKKQIFEIKSISSYTSIILLGLILASVRSYSTANSLGISVAEWAMIAVGSGIFCGIVFSVFLGASKDEDRIFLASIGAILFASGVGRALGLSSLFINFIFGVTLSVIFLDIAIIEKAVKRLLGPAFILLLFLAGMNLNFSNEIYLLLIPIYVLVRFVVIYFVLRKSSNDELTKSNPFTKKIGSVLYSQDILPLALSLSFFAGSRDLSVIILSILVPSLIINAMIGAYFSKKYLLDNSEGNTFSKKNTLGNGIK